MDLFSITCTTCKTRLKVREQAAIGQILACPKCGGMVMVKPPPNWSAGAAENAELPTATEVVANLPQVNQTIHNSAFEALDDLLADAPPKVRPPTSGTSSPGTSSPGTSSPPVPSPATAAAPATAPPVPATPGFATPVPAAPLKPRFVEGPRVQGTVRAKANATPPTAASPAAASAAMGNPTSAVPARSSTSPTAVPSPALKPATGNGSQPQPLQPPPPAEQADASSPGLAVRVRFWMLTAGSIALGVILAFLAVTAAIRLLRGPSANQPIAKGPGNGPDSAVARSSDASPDLPPADVVDPAERLPSTEPAPLPSAPLTSPRADTQPPANATTVVRTEPASDPLGIVTPPPATANSTPPSTDSLAKFDRLLTDEPPLAVPTTAPAAVVATAPETDAAAPVRPVAPRPPPREIDVAKRLADPLLGIETLGTPLADFLQVISDLSTIPITLELDALPIVNASAATPVAINAANATVGSALAAALKPLKLEAIESEGQIVVRPAEPSQLATLNFPVKDLAADDEALAALAETLRALVEPASWGDSPEQPAMNADAAKGSLAVRHTRATHAQLLLLCERLRVARGQKPISRVDPAHFTLDTRWARAQARLDTPISLNYSQPARLTLLLDRLSELGGMRILVDWRDVAAAGWNPGGEATLIVSQQPLASTLEALLAPLDLTWRIVDGQTLQVVTPARLAALNDIEFYKVGDLIADDPTGDGLLSRVLTALGDAAFRSGGGSGEIRFDEPGKCLIAALPQLKQRELEALLSRWRAAAKN